MHAKGSTQRQAVLAASARKAAITASRTPPNPSGLCLCGCGQSTTLSPFTDLKRGDVRGHPRKYVHGHHAKPQPPFYDIDSKTNCWRWRGTVTPQGYGCLVWEGVKYQAHRWMYEREVGPIPDGLELDHVRARGCRYLDCVNPAHLEPVTHVENIRRSRVRKLEPEDVAAIGRTIETTEQIADIAARFGISESHVYQIRRAHRSS